MFENRVLRRIFRPKRDKVIRKWRKLYNEELNDLDSSPRYCLGDKIENEMGGTYSMYGREEKCMQGFSGET